MLKLSDFQLKQLSDFFLRFSQIVAASLVLKIFEPGVDIVFDKLRYTVLSLGGIISFALFVIGMFVASKVKDTK